MFRLRSSPVQACNGLRLRMDSYEGILVDMIANVDVNVVELYNGS